MSSLGIFSSVQPRSDGGEQSRIRLVAENSDEVRAIADGPAPVWHAGPVRAAFMDNQLPGRRLSSGAAILLMGVLSSLLWALVILVIHWL